MQKLHSRPRGPLSKQAVNSLVVAALVALGWTSFTAFHSIEPSFLPHFHAGGRHTELSRELGDVTAPGPVSLVPVLPKEGLIEAPKSCHARAHVDLPGDVILWGGANKQASAVACCDSCRRIANVSVGSRCNVWVFCGDREKCGKQLGECWLKRLKPSEALELLQHGGPKEVMWTSGLALDKPAEEYMSEATVTRAKKQRAQLTLLEAGELTVGLRSETGTVELLSPRSAPAFSFVLPLQDTDIPTGVKETLNRSADGHHHLGDVTLRATTSGGASDSARVTCSTVAAGQVEAHRDDVDGAGAGVGGGGGGTGRGNSAGGGTLTRGESGWLWRHTRDLRAPAIDDRIARKPAGACPLEISRSVIAEPPALGGALQLRFQVRNPAAAAANVTLEDFALAMPFDHQFAGRTLVQARAGGVRSHS